MTGPAARLSVTPKGRVYKLDGAKIPSVTTILNALPKQLAQWAADAAASEAIENWDELTALPIVKRLERIRYAHRNVVKAAALRGTQIHTYGEKLAAGETVDVPDDHLGPVKAYARFLEAYHVEPVASETPVVNLKYRYGGRPDLWAWIRTRDRPQRHFALIDLKTGGKIYEDVVLQLAGYRSCDLWQPDGPKSEEPAPTPQALYVAHILPDDVRLLPVEIRPEDVMQFLYVRQTWLWLDAHGWKGEEPLIGEALRPPGPESQVGRWTEPTEEPTNA